jgi:hypothetical protein
LFDRALRKLRQLVKLKWKNATTKGMSKMTRLRGSTAQQVNEEGMTRLRPATPKIFAHRRGQAEQAGEQATKTNWVITAIPPQFPILM